MNEFKPDWDAMAVMVEEQQRMVLRIQELEAQLLDVTRSMRVWCGCGDQIMPGDEEARCGNCIAFDRVANENK